MKIFITGIAGFLGSNLAEELIKCGHSIIGIDNLSGGFLCNVPEQALFYQADCNDVEAYQSLLKDVDCVYHCAALAYEGLSVFAPHLVVKNIVTATSGVLSAAVRNGVRRFVYCSSMARYGNNKVPFSEDLPPKPVDPYGIAKVCAEMLVQNLSVIHRMQYNIAIPHNIYGPRQNYSDPYRNVVSIFINRMMRGLQPIIYGDGMQKRCFSYVDDCIGSLIKLGLDESVNCEIYNIGPDEGMITILELAQLIAKILCFSLDPIFVPGRPQEVKVATCSADKARREIGYCTRFSLEFGLIHMIEYIRKMGPKDFSYNHPLEIINSQTPKTWAEELI